MYPSLIAIKIKPRKDLLKTNLIILLRSNCITILFIFTTKRNICFRNVYTDLIHKGNINFLSKFEWPSNIIYWQTFIVFTFYNSVIKWNKFDSIPFSFLKVMFESIIGSSPKSDMAIDDIWLIPGTCGELWW